MEERTRTAIASPNQLQEQRLSPIQVEYLKLEARQEKAMDTYLVLCPTHRDHRELHAAAPEGTRFLFHDYASLILEDLVTITKGEAAELADPFDEAERILAWVRHEALTGVVSTDDYPGSALACLVARRLGLPTPDPATNLICQHKFYSRAFQRGIVPEAVPRCVLIDVNGPASLQGAIELPAFVKPVKSFFSVGAQRLTSLDELTRLQRHWARRGAFFRPFERLLERCAGLSIASNYLVAESLLSGVQTTLEGYASGDHIHVLGIVDSIMYPGTISFQRFEYPSSLPRPVQERMGSIAVALMKGLGYRDGIFNIEFMYSPDVDRVDVIEINPRMASQFADLYEKVDGTNSYSILLDIAAGRAPRRTWRQGPHRFAASCVLRRFEDALVADLPSEREIEVVSARHPGVRVEILASKGRRLSDEMQDGHSFRYGIISLGGRDRDRVLQDLDDCLSGLSFALLGLDDERTPWSQAGSSDARTEVDHGAATVL